MSSTRIDRAQEPRLSPIFSITADEIHQHVNKDPDERILCADDLANLSPSKHTNLKFAPRSRQTTALGAAEWEAALLPGELE